MMHKKLILGVALAGIAATNTQAQSNVVGQSDEYNVITTGVPFLRISPDARSGGMGDIGVATSADAASQFWNIAKMPFNEKRYGIAFTYTPWLKEISPDIWLGYVSGFVKFGADTNQAMSASLRYFSLGDIKAYDLNAQYLGDMAPREMSFDLGYSRKFSEYFSMGVSLRYINSKLISGAGAQNIPDAKPGNTVASDVGFFYQKAKEKDEFTKDVLRLGAAITNLGGKISYTETGDPNFIPTNLALGVNYEYGIDEYNKVGFGLELNKLLVPTPQIESTDSTTGENIYRMPNGKSVVSGFFGSFGDAPGGMKEELKEIQFNIGVEYWYKNTFSIRAGYFYEDRTKGDRKYFAAGVGVKYNMLTVNASYIVPSGSTLTRNPLSNTLRFTLALDFDALSKEAQ